MSNELVERKNKIVRIIDNGEIATRLNSLFSKNEEKANKFKATLLNIALDSSLQNCSPESIVKSALDLAQLDLPLSKSLGQAYIVKYKSDAEAHIGYKGWLVLAERANKAVKAKPIFKCDEFELIDNGFDETVYFKPNYDERKEFQPQWVKDNLKGVLVAIKDIGNGVLSNTFVSVGKLNQIAGVSPSVKKGGYSPYTEWGLEMFMGKAIKYVISKTAMNEDIGRAVEIDNRLDIKAIENKEESKTDFNAMLTHKEEAIYIEAE